MSTRLICQKCSHLLETWSERVLHCPNCNLLWQWDLNSASLVCLGYPPPRSKPNESSQSPGQTAAWRSNVCVMKTGPEC